MNLTYKGKSLVNSSTPGFSLEDAFLQEVWFYLHWCWLVVKVESQNDAHALLYVWDYYSIKLNAVFLLSGEVTCSLRTKGITALCRYSNWRLGSHYSVKTTKKKVDPFHFFGGEKKLMNPICLCSVSHFQWAAVWTSSLFIGKYLCVFRGHWVGEPYGAIEMTSKYFPLSCS